MTAHHDVTHLRVDPRVAYGARCAWWDSIDKVGKRGGMPCCPHCRNMLFEMPNQKIWWDGVDHHEQNGNPGYRKFIEWLRGKCFPGGFAEARAAYDKQLTDTHRPEGR